MSKIVKMKVEFTAAVEEEDLLPSENPSDSDRPNFVVAVLRAITDMWPDKSKQPIIIIDDVKWSTNDGRKGRQ